MNKYQVQASRVYGNGHSFQCTNKITAKDLCHLLNNYENNKTLNENIDKQYERITKQVIQIKLSINTLKEEIQTLSEAIECLKSK